MMYADQGPGAPSIEKQCCMEMIAGCERCMECCTNALAYCDDAAMKKVASKMFDECAECVADCKAMLEKME